MVKILPCNAGDVGCTPGGGTKIAYAMEQLSPWTTARVRVPQQQMAHEAAKILCAVIKTQPSQTNKLKKKDITFLRSLVRLPCCQCPIEMAWDGQALVPTANGGAPAALLRFPFYQAFLSRGSHFQGLLGDGGCSVKGRVLFLFLIEGWHSIHRKEILITTNGCRLLLGAL